MKRTELVFILDRSGSMSGLEEDTIGGYNSMLKKQKKEAGEVIVTTVLFDSRYDIIHDRENIKNIKDLTENEYYVRGTTALLDAVGITLNNITRKRKKIKKDQDKVMFVIITDGMENSSSEYSYEKIKTLIDYQKEKYSWEFIFLGANIDAVETASKFGINEDRAVNYHADSEGTRLNYKEVSNVILNIRKDKTVDSNWKKNIEEDFEKRERINKDRKEI